MSEDKNWKNGICPIRLASQKHNSYMDSKNSSTELYRLLYGLIQHKTDRKKVVAKLEGDAYVKDKSFDFYIAYIMALIDKYLPDENYKRDLYAVSGLQRTVLRSKTDAMRSERTNL